MDLRRTSLSARLALEPTHNGLPHLKSRPGIARVKSAKSIGARSGKWLLLERVQALLNAPAISTTRGLRERAIIAVLLGGALRQSAVVALADARSLGAWALPAARARQPAHGLLPDAPRLPANVMC